MPGAMSLPTANVPSWSIVVFGPGGGVGSGSAPATPTEAVAAQPTTSSPAATYRAATGAPALNLIEQQRTGLSSPFHICGVARPPRPVCVARPPLKLGDHGQWPRQSDHTSWRTLTSLP